MHVCKRKILLAVILCFNQFFCIAQKNLRSNFSTILVKIDERKNVSFVDLILNKKNIEWQKITSRFNVSEIKPASILQNTSRMNHWLALSFSSHTDSFQLVYSLKKLSFVSCIQQKPKELILSADSSSSQNFKTENNELPWYITKTHIDALWKLPKKKNIVIAVVDDGVRMTHKDIASHIWTNEKEIPNNNKDDDGDGFVDDVHGWDVADNDNDASPPADRLKDFYHGTHIAGEIALCTPQLPQDNYKIEIMPVKCLADDSKLTYLKDGYKGIEYAIKAGANIINCSWGGGPFSQYEKDLLQTAADKNILAIASAGNFLADQVQYPAGDKNVIAVTGVDSSLIKPHDFNYGQFISFSAPGLNISAADAMDDSSRTFVSGTSEAVPVVASEAALLMSCFPELTAQDIIRIMKNSSLPIDSINHSYAGKLGAGFIDASKALAQIGNETPSQQNDTVTHTQGFLVFDKNNPAKKNQQTWFIHPYGSYPGMVLHFPSSFKKSKGNILIYKNAIANTNIIGQYSLNQLPDSLFAAENSLYINFTAEKLEKNFQLIIPFHAITVDSSCLYCSGIKELNTDEGMFSDGSGDNNYAGRTSCQWLITAAPGKKITLAFTKFDTEPRVDFVYVFDGDKTNAKIIGLFSGPNIPPVITSSSNKMLVWFVTNETVNGKGWTAKYTTQ